MKKAYIQPIAEISHILVENVIAASLTQGEDLTETTYGAGKEREQAAEDQQNGWNDGLW